MLRILSLGGGVQSTTIALMAANGELDAKPDFAIFADTGWEPRTVYQHLSWLTETARLGFPTLTVRSGNIRDDILATAKGLPGNRPSIPWFTVSPSGKKGRRLRQCTERYKLQPILRQVREILGVGARSRIPPGSVEMWIGISKDEAIRARHSRRLYVTNRYPLLEMGMAAIDCLAWLKSNSYPVPPKSACVGCPFHSDDIWREMQLTDPDAWNDAVEMDQALRSGCNGKMRGTPYMHPSRAPLSQIAFASGGINRFGEECQGLCGV